MIRGITFLLCCVAAAQDETFRITTHVVQVPAVVTSSNRHSIDGLVARDFRVHDNGVQQEIKVDDFSAGLPPVSLIVAIQSSGLSKLAMPRIRRIAGLIEPLVSGARGEAAVVSFDTEVHWLQDFTSSDDKIRVAIKSIRSAGSGGGHMFDALVEIAERTKQRAGRKILLLISEAQDGGSRVKFQQAVEAVERENVEVFAVHYSAYAMSWIAKPADFPDKPELDEMFYRELARIGATNHARALSFATGGNEYSFSSQRALENAISQMASEVHGQYLITFVQRDASPGMHRIEVTVPGQREVKVRARQAYWSEPDTR